MANTDAKLLIKTTDKENGYKWIHLCYVEEDVFKEFTSVYNISLDGINSMLSKWCKEDFNVDNPMATIEDIQSLKDLVKEKYKKEYPEIYRDSDTDRQGWFRVWVTKNMKEEIEYGKTCV